MPNSTHQEVWKGKVECSNLNVVVVGYLKEDGVLVGWEIRKQSTVWSCEDLILGGDDLPSYCQRDWKYGDCSVECPCGHVWILCCYWIRLGATYAGVTVGLCK